MSYPENRKQIRYQIADGLETGMTSASAVYPYMKSGFDGASRVVRVVTGGSMRPPFSPNGTTESEFFYLVQLFVLYFEEGEPTVQQEADDDLDQLEYEFYAWMAANQQRPDLPVPWKTLNQESRSLTDLVKIGAHFYILENIPIRCAISG